MFEGSLLGKAISAAPRSVVTTLAAGLIADTLFISWIAQRTPGDVIRQVLIWGDVSTTALSQVRSWLTDRQEIVTALLLVVAMLTVVAVGACVSKGTFQLWDDFRWTGALCACALVHVDLAGPSTFFKTALLFIAACLAVAVLTRDGFAGMVMAMAPVMLALTPALAFISWVSHGIDPDRRAKLEGSIRTSERA